MKKPIYLSCLLLILAFLLSGCPGMLSTKPYESIAPLRDEALVYVYRPESIWFRGVPYIIYAGEEKHEPLINNGYFPIHLPPGVVHFRLTRATGFTEQPVDDMEMTVEAGKVHYLKVEPWPYGLFKLKIMDIDEGQREASATEFYYEEK